MPGRGDALMNAAQCEEGMASTQAFVTDLFESAKEARAKGLDLKATFDATKAKMDPKYGDWVIYEHCMPFDASRAWDEAGGMERPQIWTAERDKEMWAKLNG